MELLQHYEVVCRDHDTGKRNNGRDKANRRTEQTETAEHERCAADDERQTGEMPKEGTAELRRAFWVKGGTHDLVYDTNEEDQKRQRRGERVLQRNLTRRRLHEPLASARSAQRLAAQLPPARVPR